MAKYASRKYPEKAILDIGANIGDSASFISRQSQAKLILVEGSKYFAEFLRKNSAKLHNEHEIHQVLLGEGTKIKGSLFHWGGTAYFNNSDTNEHVQTAKLSSITNDHVSFIKLDTDGHDAQILLSSIDWITQHKPSILMELQIRNNEDVAIMDELFELLKSSEYNRYIIWDSAGRFLISTQENTQIKQLSKYLLKSHHSSETLGDLDIACIHQDDSDIFESVVDWYAKMDDPSNLKEWIMNELYSNDA